MSFTYAIGDIHGRSDLLRSALDTAYLTNRNRAPGRFIQLGDIVDRGPDSRGCVEMLMTERRQGWDIMTLQGNHETMMLGGIRNPNEARRHWFNYGGIETMESYGFPPKGDHGGDLVKYLDPLHLDWIAKLPPFYADQHRVYVHAGVERDLSLGENDATTFQWKRYDDFDPGWTHDGRHVVHGHTIRREPILHTGRTGLDTGAYVTGRIFIAVFDDEIAGGPIDLIELKR